MKIIFYMITASDYCSDRVRIMNDDDDESNNNFVHDDETIKS